MITSCIFLKYIVHDHHLSSSFCAVEHHNLGPTFSPPLSTVKSPKGIEFSSTRCVCIQKYVMWEYCSAIDIGLYKKERTPLHLAPHLLEQGIFILFRKI